jgi:hypothetical protein
MADYGIKGFEKALAKAVPNFDPFKVVISKKGSSEVKITLLVDGQMINLIMYRSDFEIERWCDHLIEYFDTGKFDMHSYWTVYTSELGPAGPKSVDYNNNVYKVSMCLKKGVIEEHTEGWSILLDTIREENKDTGFTMVRKGVDKELVVL